MGFYMETYRLSIIYETTLVSVFFKLSYALTSLSVLLNLFNFLCQPSLANTIQRTTTMTSQLAKQPQLGNNSHEF